MTVSRVTIPEPIRRLNRRVLRKIIRTIAPDWLKSILLRVPFSRYHALVYQFLHGSEIVDWNNTSIYVDPGTIHGYFLYIFGSYNPEEIQQLILFCSDAKHFVDVGAHSGLISLAVAQACPNVRVTAFEPDQAIAAKFRANLALNIHLQQRVQLVELAVSDQMGTIIFAPSNEPGCPEVGRIAPDCDGLNPSAYPVETVRLDTFMWQDHLPDVVKIEMLSEQKYRYYKV